MVAKHSKLVPTTAYRLFALLAGVLFSTQLTAQGASLSGNVIHIPVLIFADQAFEVELTLVEGSNPLQVSLTHASELSGANPSGASLFDGVTLTIPAIAVDGLSYWANFTLISMEPQTFELAAAGAVGPNPPPRNCTRPQADPSHGVDNPIVTNGFLVPVSSIVDGGPGPDGIPAIESPLFTHDFVRAGMQSQDLVIGVKIGDVAKAYPHRVMDYHEIVNDRFTINGSKRDVTLSYCPLTGSAVLWESFAESVNKSFGVSGLLYNSNLILYDRETGSLWSQMLEQAITGPEVKRIPDRLQVVETSWENWLAMFPETLVLMIEESEFSFPYEFYPYGFYRQDESVLYEVNDLSDDRLHRKERVVGINVGNASKVYPISRFINEVTVINDRVGSMDVVAAGSSNRNFGMVYNRQLEDCTTLDFTAVPDLLPIIMQDNEGGHWDVFGNAVSGPRMGARLQKTNSYIAYWFAWAAFFPGAEIYQ